MNQTHRMSLPVLLCAALLWFAPDAHAYIDGGTASMMFQMLIGGLVAASLFLKTFWYATKNFVLNLLGKGDPQSADSDPADEPASVDD